MFEAAFEEIIATAKQASSRKDARNAAPKTLRGFSSQGLLRMPIIRGLA
jgi:hypothetical protein